MSKNILYIISFLLCFASNNAIAQEFEWDNSIDSTGRMDQIIELKDGKLITLSASYYRFSKNFINLYDRDGNLLRSKTWSIDTLTTIFFRSIWLESKQKYMLIGTSTAVSDSSYRYYMMTVYFDKDLNFSDEKIHFLTSTLKSSDRYPVPYHYGVYKAENDTLYLSVAINDVSSVREQHFLKLDNNANIISEQVVDGLICTSIITDLNGFLCLGGQPYYFNNRFEFLKTEFVGNLVFATTNQSKSVRMGHSKILVGTLQGIASPPEYDGGGALLYYLDNDLKVKKYNGIVTAIGYTLPANVFDMSPDSSIYTSTCDGPFSGATKFYLGKFDINLNKKWQLEYSAIGEYRYSMWGLEATNDNGIIVYGGRYNWSGSEKLAYMIKFNENGNISWTHNVDKDFLLIKSYPNPSTGPLNIDITGITGQADVRVYDMQGRNVYVQEGIESGTTTMDLSGLAAGTYIYKIYDGSKMIGSGEWVKM